MLERMRVKQTMDEGEKSALTWRRGHHPLPPHHHPECWLAGSQTDTQRTDEVRLGQVRSGQVRSGQVRSGRTGNITTCMPDSPWISVEKMDFNESVKLSFLLIILELVNQLK